MSAAMVEGGRGVMHSPDGTADYLLYWRPSYAAISDHGRTAGEKTGDALTT